MERANLSAPLSEPLIHLSSSSGHYPHHAAVLGEKRIVAPAKHAEHAYFGLLVGQVFCGALTYSSSFSHIYSTQLSQTNLDLQGFMTFGAYVAPAVVLDNAYTLTNESEVHAFLAEHPPLVSVLSEFAAYLKHTFAISKIELSHRFDAYYEIDALFVTPIFSNSDVAAAITANDRILDEFFFSHQEAIGNSLVLSL